MTESLCRACGHVREVISGTGSHFLLCRLSQTDARFSKYPPQPVIQCAGFSSNRDEENADKENPGEENTVEETQ